MKNLLSILLLASITTSLFAGDEISLIRVSDSWRFLKGTAEASSPVDAWRQVGFDDSGWTEADAGFGYGGLAPATLLDDMPGNYNSVFLRKSFTVDDPSQIKWLVLRADYDDGFIAYLNGVEVWRQGFGLGTNVPYNASAPFRTSIEAEDFNISYAITNLVSGTNVLAIQAHNNDINSADFRIIPELLANYTRGPYVQDMTTNQVTIIWKTPVAEDSTVYYGTSTNLGQAVWNSTLTTQHVMTLTGLQPGTRYYYQISSSTNGVHDIRSNIRSFKTFPDTGDVSFIVMGDSGFGSSGQYDIANVMRQQDVDFFVHVGDVIYPEFTYGETDLKCLSVYGEQMAEVPFYFAVGNHDIQQYIDNGNCIWDEMPFLEAFYLPTNSVTGTEHFYSFDAGNAHIVVLNSDKRLHAYSPGSPQYNWLNADLAASTKPWKFIIFHHCPFTSSVHRFDDNDFFNASNCDWTGNGTPDRDEIQASIGALASQHGAHIMFYGHEHNYEKFNPAGGVHSVLTGGGGADIRGMNANPNDIDSSSSQFWSTYNMVTVTLKGDALIMDSFDDNGDVFDNLYIQRAAPPSQTWRSAWHSPTVETGGGSNDGNHPGQNLDFIGEPIPTLPGDFSNLGRVFVNNDETNLYLAIEQALFYDSNNIFLFLDVPSLSGVSNMTAIGNGFLDPDGQGADGLDMLKNLSFQNFEPDLAFVLGDEYGDGNFRSFARPSNFNIGQGAFRLDAGISDIPNVRIQQYNRSPQNSDVGYEQNANFIEICIPFASLNNLQPSGQVIRIGAVVGGGGYTEANQTRYLDSSHLGQSLSGTGENSRTLEPVSVLLQGAGDDPDNDGLTNAEETTEGTRPDQSDTDKDGLLDGWEVDGGLNPNSPVGEDGPLGNPDGDSMNNRDEHLAGTHPNDDQSVFDGKIKWVPQGAVIYWPSIPQRKYNLHRATSMTGTFLSILSEIQSTPPENTYTDSTSNLKHSFYQIEVYED